MAIALIIEFEPIFSPGFHEISLDNLEKIFVEPFHENEKRADLTRRFRDYVCKLSELDLNVEIWVHGSYSTHKQEPNDIDVLIVFDPIEVNNLPEEKKPIFEELFDRDLSKIRYSIDILSCAFNDPKFLSFCSGWVGFYRDKQHKGIPKLYYGIY